MTFPRLATLASLFALAFAMPREARANHLPYAFGDVFVGVGSGLVRHFDGAGNLLETLDTTTGCSEDLGMAFTAAGHLIGTHSFGSCSPGRVVEFDAMGGLIGPFGSGYSSSTESVVIDGAGNVYIGQPDGTADVLKFDAAGNPLGSFDVPTENRGSDWIDLAADQCTLFYTSEGTRILRYDVCTSTPLADFASGLHGAAFALRILPDGGVVVADTIDVHRLDASGTIVGTWTPPASETSFFFALNLDPDAVHFWTASYSSGNVYKYDLTAPATAPVFSFNGMIAGSALSGLAIFGERTVGRETNCTDGVDNDGDGSTDCADTDCVLDPACIVTTTSTTTTSSTTTTTLPGCAAFPCGHNGTKESVCHIPPGNPGRAQTICIGRDGVPAHLVNHRDRCGPCR